MRKLDDEENKRLIEDCAIAFPFIDDYGSLIKKHDINSLTEEGKAAILMMVMQDLFGDNVDALKHALAAYIYIRTEM